MSAAVLERIVAFCARNAGVIALLALAVGIASGFYSTTHFAMNSDPASLISAQTNWRKRNAQFDAEFPQLNNTIVAVIDGATPELAARGANEIASALRKMPKLFHYVRQPGGGDFFAHEGLLFLPVAQVRSTTEQLIAAQPFLGAMAVDPSLRGVMDSLATALDGVKRGNAKFDTLRRPIRTFVDTLSKVVAGERAFLAWRSLLTGDRPTSLEIRQFVETQPKLEFESLTPGNHATDIIRSLAHRLRLSPDDGVRVRLTGAVPLADEEFGTIRERAVLMTTLMFASIFVMLWLAVRMLRLIFAILLTVLIGLMATGALGLLAIGSFNVISVAFIPLFVGLGVDFGIQFCVRYRAERHISDDLDRALARAGSGVGNALTLAAAATAAGFYSFLPTSYSGVAELGLISGTGMLVTFALSITLLPALLKLARPPGEPETIGYTMLAPLDVFLRERRHAVMGVALLLAAICVAALPRLHFDFNPLDLRNAKSESVATALDLLKDPATSPNTIDILAPTHPAARRLTLAISALPAVSQVLALDSFVPEDQAPKLALIRDAHNLLDPTLSPFLIKPAPSDTDVIVSLKNAAGALRAVIPGQHGNVAGEAQSLAALLGRIAQGPVELRTRAQAAFVPGLQTLLQQLRAALTPRPVTLATLPQSLSRDWVGGDGKYRLQVFPKGDANNNGVIQEFTRQVRIIAPEATGEPISIQESGRTIVRAFIQAGVLSFLSITFILVITLRRLIDVAIALAPLILAGALTLGTCVFIGLRMNFADIIALPLIFGIGVAFDIYFVMAWRSGMDRLLQSPLTRAVILSAGTTASGFGSLWVSSHPGLASMGELLAISLAWILITVLFLLPALLAQASARGGMPEVV
jgi:hopanoid biosynthesis associated RND transporter like protein HpnN